MNTLPLLVLTLGATMSLLGLPNAQAAGSHVDASEEARTSPQPIPLLPESIEATAVRWEQELDRVAFDLEERALVESGGDALVQSLLARADQVRVQRSRLQECSVRRPSELARLLYRSIERTPEAAPMERKHVADVINVLAASAAP